MEPLNANVLVGRDFRSFAVLSPYQVQGQDVYHIEQDKLAISDVRTLIDRAAMRPVQADYVVFIIAVRTIDHEAQNALLKILEEPPTYVRIFLVIPNIELLLQTVRSRLAFIDETTDTANDNYTFKSFRLLSFRDRITLIEQRTKAKDIAWITAVISGAEAYAEKYIATEPGLAEAAQFAALHTVRRGASQKMLLDHLALSLPVAG